MTDDERIVLAGEYVLGTLSAEERAAVEAMLPGDTALAAEIWLWQSRLAPLGPSAPSVEPPPRVWAGIAKQLMEEARRRPAGTPDNDNTVDLRRKVGVWRTATVAFALLAAALVAAVFLSPVLQVNETEERYLAFVNPDGGLPPIVVDYNPATGVVTAQSLGAAAPPNRSYELWYITEGQDVPLSLGLLDQPGARIVMAAAEIAAFDPTNALFAVTDEPAGGAPAGGGPTGAIVLQGELVRATF